MTMTYGQIESSLQAAIAETVPDDSDSYVYVCDFSDTYVIYCLNYDEYLQDDYSMDDDGNITMTGSPIVVKPMTSYVPVEQQAALKAMLETRGLRTGSTPRIEHRATEQRSRRIQVVSEPFTYRRDSTDDRGNGISYFRDIYMRNKDPKALERLVRHTTEMRDFKQRKADRALRAFQAGAEEHGFEYRVNPNPTAGTGGNFDPPAWLVELAATFPRPKRVLANLVNQFPLPPGASSVNIPVMVTGNAADNQAPGGGSDSSDVTDSAASCNAITISGMGDVALQVLEMGPVSGATDHAWFKDLHEAYDYNLETQLVVGTGGTGPGAQFTGLYNVSNLNNVTYTDAAPTGSKMYPYFGQAAAAIGKKRGMPPYAWLMPTSRWAWLRTSEDAQGLPLDFPELNGDDNASCPGAIAGWPVWMEDSIPRTLGANGNQDTVIGCIPQDIYLFEGTAVASIGVEVLSGTLGARFTYRNYASAITNRYATGISVLSGTGLIPVSGY